MNIIINQKRLSSAIKLVEHIISRNTSLPILSTILLKTEGGKLKLTATNLEIGIHILIGAKIEKEGVIAIPARVFSEFISNIKDEKITLSVEKEVLVITSENTKTQVLGVKPDEFPIIPSLKNTEAYNLSTRILESGFSHVVDSTSLLETRPELSGVCVTMDNGSISFAATDSFRLAEFTAKTNIKQQKTFIVPRMTAMEIIRICSDKDEEVSLLVSDSQIAIKGSDIELISRLIDGNYPDYKKVIPESFKTSVSIKKEELERTARMVSIFSSNVADVMLDVEGGTLQLNAKNSDKGDINSKINISPIKTPFNASLNYRYLLDGLKVMKDTDITLNYAGPGMPIVLKGEKESNFVYVIMPLRTS